MTVTNLIYHDLQRLCDWPWCVVLSSGRESEVGNCVASSSSDNKSERRLPKLDNSESELTMKNSKTSRVELKPKITEIIEGGVGHEDADVDIIQERLQVLSDKRLLEGGQDRT